MIAVLQGWGKSTMSGRVLGVAFIIALGYAAIWGFRTILGLQQ
ncbi:MAG TPA: hypothetical protein VKQ89_07920 [Candidatus Angelobacter sp.]|nr:hypothetical protein [Candidatus Angelobacter sp.]